MSSLLLRAALLLAPLAGSPFTVRGTVIDPQHLPIAGARVVTTCERQDVPEAGTDRDGRFELIGVTPGTCVIEVSAPGFTTARVAAAAQPDPLVVQLSIANHVDAVIVRPARPRRSLFGVSLTGDDVTAAAGTTSGLIRHAALLAGAGTRPVVVYVDGLAASTLPALTNVEQISVDADRFAAEYGEATAATVRIITKAPDRAFRVRSNSDLLDAGGRLALADGARADSTQRDVTLSAGVPKLPASFAATVTFQSLSMPVEFVPPDAGELTSGDSSLSGGLTVHFAAPHRTRGSVSYRERRGQQSNLGVGGWTLPSAAYDSRTLSHEVRATALRATDAVDYEGGVSASIAAVTTRAASDAAGITIGGALTMGGAPTSASETRTLRWTVRQAFRINRRGSISAGVVASGRSERWSRTPNPSGWWQFDSVEAYQAALEGAAVGSRFVASANVAQRFSSIAVAPYLQATVARTGHAELTAGLRADYQSRMGTAWLPRVAAAVDRGGILLILGAGLFAGSQPEHVFSALAARGAMVTLPGGTSSLTTRVSPAFARPLTLLASARAERQLGPAAAMAEYSFASDRRLPGSARTITAGEWVDIVESNRTALTHRVSTQVRGAWKRQFFSAQYEWIHARDNSDGAFTFPEEPGDLRAEWAPAAGVAPHNVTLMATLALPGAMSVAMTGVWRGPAPFNITTGLDRFGNGLVNDRGGRPRNSGRDRGYHSLGLYASRSMKVWKWRPRIGVQIENLLDVPNVLSVGSVAGAPGFGAPVATSPGRSVRMFATWF